MPKETAISPDQLTAIRDTAPDVIYVPGYYQEVGVIAKQTKQLGIKGAAPGR